jgi:hypothetical protein
MKYTLLLLVVCMFGACNQNKQQCSYVILLDISASRDSQFTAWSRTIIETTILPRLGAKDRLVVKPIDGGSVTAPDVLFRIDCGAYKFGNEFAGLAEAEIIKKAIADTVLHAWQRNEPVFDSIIVARKVFSSQTDIVGALEGIRHDLEPAYRAHVFLFSDMLHDEGAMQLNNVNTQTDVVALTRSITPAPLHGTQVTVLTGTQHISKEQFVLVRNFWEEYFRQSGATLISYGNPLALFSRNEFK